MSVRHGVSDASLVVRPIGFYTLFLVVGVGTFLLHEFAHWLTGTALGYDMVATPNHVWPTTPMLAWEQLLLSASGPVVTIAQAIVGFLLVGQRRSLFGFALLYMAFFMRLVAAGVSVFNPNDEARVSQALGLGTWTLPLLVVVGLFVMVFMASRTLRLRFRDQFFCYLVASVAVTLIVGTDMLFWRPAEAITP
jgi:hypothetical protein